MLEMNELTHEEELALIGLLKAVIQADKELSRLENVELKRVAAVMGPERFEERVAEARELFVTLSDIKGYAERVERQPARQLIFNLLEKMAKEDGLIPEEEEVLAWLADLWGVEYFCR
jgi:uncharacterized tellurite resistance protein B-like protein